MLGGVALACVAGRAEAADSRLRIQIPPRSYADALIDLGLQANVSVLGTASCGAGGRAELSGRYTLEEALSRLLAGAPCRYRVVDSRTVRISPAPVVLKLPPDPREPPRAPGLVAEVLVTATKRPAAPGRLPAGVSAIPREQIQATRATNVSQTIGQLAGVLSTNLGPGRDKLLIRGLSDGAFTGRTRATVATYLDDAPVNVNAPDPDLRLVDIERIEVVRGPQGALYGSGSIAGIYKIVTAKPDLQRFETGGSASVATTAGGDASHEIDGYANLPLVQGRIGLRLAAYRDVQGGYLDDLNLRVTNVDQTRRDGGRLAVRIQFDDHWRIDALAASQHLRSNDTQYVTRLMAGELPRLPAMPDEGGGPIGAPDDRGDRIRETHNNDFSYAGVSLHGAYGWGSLTSTTTYVHHVFSSQYDATAARVNFPASTAQLGVYGESTRSNMLVQELVVRSETSGRLDWLVGVYGARTVARSPSTLEFLSPGQASVVYSENRKDRLTEYAVYGEGSYDLGGGWTVSLGARLFQSRVHTTADLDISPPFAARAFDDARTFNGFSPKLSVQYEFASGDLVYALISEGYRPGGFNSSGFREIAAGRVTYRPDRLRNYEVGLKFRRLDDRLSVRTAAYFDDWVNIQTDRYRPSGLAYTSNIADARVLGLEAEVAYDFGFGLSLRANGLITDSETRHPNADIIEGVGDALPLVPRSTGGLLAIYEHALGSDLTLRLVAETNYVGRSRLTFTNPQRSTDDYIQARLAAELERGDWRVMAFVTNPINDAADTFAYGNPFSFTDVNIRQVTPQRPRTFGLRLAAAF